MFLSSAMRCSNSEYESTIRTASTPCRGSFGSIGVPSVGTTFRSSFTLNPARDGFDHLGLHVFRIHTAVGSDPAREPDCEPAAAGAEIGDDAAVANLQRVHDAIGLLPVLAIRPFERTELRRRKQTRMLRGRNRATDTTTRPSVTNRITASLRCARHGPSHAGCARHPWCRSVPRDPCPSPARRCPAHPGMSWTPETGSRPARRPEGALVHGRVRCTGLPVLTDAFAISAVAA